MHHRKFQINRPINKNPPAIFSLTLWLKYQPTMRFGHNFWLGGAIDTRPMRLNCILQDLIRDIPLDHIWNAQIRAQIRPNTPNIVFGVRIWDTLMTITKHGLYKYKYKFVLLSQKPVTLQPHYNDHWPDCEKTYPTNHKPEYHNPLHENCYRPYWRWQLNIAKITSTLIYRTHVFSLKTHLKT